MTGACTGVARRPPRRGAPAAAALVVAVCCVLPGWACGRAGDGAPSAVVERDSAGIRIVENPASALEVELAVPATPELQIGVLDGEPAYQLYQVSAAARLADGRLVVANAGTREVRFYGPDGVHRVTVGGAGQGPEEFRYPASLLLEAGDTVVVQDMLDRVRYSPGGTSWAGSRRTAIASRMRRDRAASPRVACGSPADPCSRRSTTDRPVSPWPALPSARA